MACLSSINDIFYINTCIKNVIHSFKNNSSVYICICVPVHKKYHCLLF